jgi:hypothetical protein
MVDFGCVRLSLGRFYKRERRLLRCLNLAVRGWPQPAFSTAQTLGAKVKVIVTARNATGEASPVMPRSVVP